MKSLFTPDEPVTGDFACITDKRLVQAADLPKLVNWVRDSPELMLDWETTGVKVRQGYRAFMAGFYAPDLGARIVDFRHLPEAGVAAVRDGLLARGQRTTVAFNSGFEHSHAQALGIKMGPMWCSLSAAYATNELRKDYGEFGKLTQKALVHHELGVVPKYAIALDTWIHANVGRSDKGGPSYYNLAPPTLMVPYCCEDLETGWQLHKKLEKQVIANGQEELVRTDSALGPIIEEMQQRGMRLNVPRAMELVGIFSAELKKSVKIMFEALGHAFDYESHQKVFGILYGELHLPMHKDQEKAGSVDDDVIAWMLTLPQVKESPRLTAFLTALDDAREFVKLKNTYLLPWIYEWMKDGILYPNLNLTVARTRRFTADNPNLQNIPVRTKWARELRKLFISRDDFTTYSMDESQAEYRAFAHYSQDPGLLAAYRSSRKADLHKEVSDWLEVDRDTVGKHLNFGMVYGLGEDKLSRKLLRPVNETKAILAKYHKRFTGIASLKAELKIQVARYGYVRDVFGGRRHMTPDEAYKGINSICQMTVANMIRRSMVRADPLIKAAGGHLLMQVHDELVVELPGTQREAPEHLNEPHTHIVRKDHLATLKHIREEAMEDFPEFSVPIISSCDRWAPNWYDTESVDTL